jgi:hypothetical protein
MNEKIVTITAIVGIILLGAFSVIQQRKIERLQVELASVTYILGQMAKHTREEGAAQSPE